MSEPALQVLEAEAPRGERGRGRGASKPKDAPTTEPSRRTEAANAALFARLHGEFVRHVAKWSAWLVWKNGHWVRDDGAVLMMELAKDVGKRWFREAVEAVGVMDRDTAIAWGRSSSSARGIRALIELARGIAGIPVDHEELDNDPWLFGVKNGVIELRTGRLRPANPSDLMTMQSPIAFNPGAAAPRWERALEQWFPDPAVRQYVQRLVGAALVGVQRDHVFVIHYGGGRNGKGTFTRALLVVFGPYAVTPHISLLVQQKHSEHDTVKADLFRCRLAVAVETERRTHLAEASVKNLTGGDPIKCRRLYENPWEFTPSHSLWLQTNYLPKIAGRDRGVWSRIRVVEWKSTFVDRAADTNLDETLAAEAPGILAWCVRGCLMWQRDGLAEPEAVIRATLVYRQAEDTFARFAADVGLAFAKPLRYDATGLLALLDEWAEGEGIKASHSEFTEWLKEHGAQKIRVRTDDGRQPRVWSGVGMGDLHSTAVPSVPGESMTFPMSLT